MVNPTTLIFKSKIIAGDYRPRPKAKIIFKKLRCKFE
jgi:hypothetical protein